MRFPLVRTAKNLPSKALFLHTLCFMLTFVGTLHSCWNVFMRLAYRPLNWAVV